MEFNDFVAALTQWFDLRTVTPLDCWIDDANARLAHVEGGIRCSMDVLDPYDASAPERLMSILGQGGASVACHCDGALAIDPESHCLVLVFWLAPPCNVPHVLNIVQSLANQRAAMLSLMHKTVFDSPRAEPRSVTPTWHPGV
ncbi:type III secretion protein [Pseudomonas sp. SDO528_S397]